MERTIHKYPVIIAPIIQVHQIPGGAEFLDVQLQDGIAVMWWSIPLNERSHADWQFAIVATGGEFNDSGWTYLGTVQYPEEGFVGHVYGKRTDG